MIRRVIRFRSVTHSMVTNRLSRDSIDYVNHFLASNREGEREGGRSFVIPSVCVCLPPYGAEHLWAPGVCPPVERRMTRYWVTWWRDCRYLSNPNESWCTMEAASITHLRLKYSTCPATFSFTLFYFCIFFVFYDSLQHDMIREPRPAQDSRRSVPKLAW